MIILQNIPISRTKASRVGILLIRLNTIACFLAETKKHPWFLLIFFLKLSTAVAVPDSLTSDKAYFKGFINSGMSIGKNQYTYGYGGRFVMGLGAFYYKNRAFGGVEFHKTSFKDVDDPDFKVGQWIKTKAVQKVNVFSINMGRTLGSGQNISLSGGLGYLQYKFPIVDSRDGLLFSTYYVVDSYEMRHAPCITSSLRIYSEFTKPRVYAMLSGYTSKPISFVSLNIGIDFNLAEFD